MRKITLFLSILLILGILPTVVDAQNVKFKPKAFSTRNMRIALGVGYELKLGILSIPVNENIVFKDKFDTTSVGFGNFSFDIDLYSPNSLVGLYFPIGYTFGSFTVNDSSNHFDAIQYKKIEVPLYLKLRTGERNGDLHLWFGLGASYNIINSVARNYYVPNATTGYVYYDDLDKNQMKNHMSAGLLIGAEIFNYKTNEEKGRSLQNEPGRLRLLTYFRANYNFQNSLNNDYKYFLAGSNKSAISNNKGFELKYVTFSFAMKFFLRMKRNLPKK